MQVILLPLITHSCCYPPAVEHMLTTAGGLYKNIKRKYIFITPGFLTF